MQKDYCSVRKKSETRVAAASICLSRQASLPDGSQVLRGKIFFVTFLYRLCVTRRIVSRGWKSLPVNFPFRREDNRAGHIGDGML